MNDKPTEQTISDLPVITKFIYSIGVLPTSYKMSMTYEEQVVWLCNYLETTVIPAVNQNGEAVEELQNLYELLRTYVNDYFDNLDVQEEINNKLEQMAEDGSLYNIIRQYTDPIVNQQNEEIASFKNEVNDSINEINTNVNVIDNKVDEIANGSPLVASSTTGMTDTTKIYVNTTDGKWYWYDGDSWEIGGTYQSAGIGDNSLNYYMLDSELQTNLKLNDYSRGELTIIGNYYNGNVGSAISQTQFNTAESGVMNVVKDDIVVIPFVGRTNNYGTIPAIVLTDENDIVKEKITFATLVESVVTNNTPYMFRVGANVRKVYFNNNIIENVSAYHMRWYPYKVNSFNYMDSRVTYNMDNYTIISPSETETGVFYSQDQWAKELEGYRTLKYNVAPLEKIHVDSIIPGATQFTVAIFTNANGYPTGYLYPAGTMNETTEVSVDTIVPAGSYKMYISQPTTYELPVVKKYMIGNENAISNKKLSVSYNSNTLTITNNTNANKLTFTNYGGNNLFMIKSYKVGETTATLSTDMIPAPYIVSAVENADGDKTDHIFTGGNHQWNNAASGSTATARQVDLDIYCDNIALVDGSSNVQCDSIKIIETNRVQGWNTCKQDGSGREILEEKIVFTFDGSSLKVINTITPLEKILIETYYGIQTAGVSNNQYLVYADKLYDVNTINNLTEKPYQIFGGDIISSKMENAGLGDYRYNLSDTKVNISNSKSYYVPIKSNTTQFTTTNINYIVGEYIFDKYQK